MALDIKKALTEKLGPLPAWAYVVGGVAIYWFFFRNSSGSGSAGTQAVSNVPAVGTALSGYLPNDSSITGGTTPGGVNTVCGPGTILDPAGSGQCIPSPAANTTAPPPVGGVPSTLIPNYPILGASPPLAQPVGPATVPASGIPANPSVGSVGLPASYAGDTISPQEEAYLSGGPAGESSFLGLSNNLPSGINTNPSGYGGLSAASVPGSVLNSGGGPVTGNLNNAGGVPVSNPNIAQVWNGSAWVPL